MFSFEALPQQFVLEALPSANVSLGNELEIKCSANDTSPLLSIALLSRMRGPLNATCSVSLGTGYCTYVVENVQLSDFGKYDCMKRHKDGNCYTKSLVIHQVVRVPTEITTLATMNTTQSRPRTEVRHTTTRTTTVTSRPKTTSERVHVTLIPGSVMR